MQPQISFEPLTPTAFLRRSATVFGERIAVIDNDVRYTYRELYDRTRRLAGALHALGIRDGARAAVLAPNTHVLLEAHYGVPLAGAVLVALNQRLTAGDLAYAVEHSEAGILIYDYEFEAVARAIEKNLHGLKLIRAGGQDEYEDWIAGAQPLEIPVADERAMISINYTSGTTGKPKGVMYHHRGAYLQALAMVAHMRLDYGRCPCSTAMAGASHGPSPPPVRRICVCANWMRNWSGNTCVHRASRTSARRRLFSS